MAWQYTVPWSGDQPNAGDIKRWLMTRVPPFANVEVAVQGDGTILVNADRDPRSALTGYTPGALTSSTTSAAIVLTGTGSPEGVVTAPPGTLFVSTNGHAYQKRSGAGNTGWTKT